MILLDTSGLLAILDRREATHPTARDYVVSTPARLTHNYVFAEFVALARTRGIAREITLDFCDVVQRDTEMVWVDRSLHARGMGLLRARTDRRYSLCDAVSFVLMRQRRITDALTTDHHFEQEGFVRLLR